MSTTMSSVLARLGWQCAAHPWRVVAIWCAIVAASFGLAAAMGDQPRGDHNAPETLDSRGYDFLTKTFPDMAGADARVVVRTSSGRLSPSALDALRHQLQAVSGVSTVSPPRLSEAGDTALIALQYRVPITKIHGPQGVDALRQAVAPSQQSGLEVDLGGEVPENYTADGGTLEKGAVLAVGCLLVLTAGSVSATVVAPALGLFGVGTGMALMLVIAGFVSPVSGTAPIMAAALGIGMCIDYAILVLARFRENLPLCTSARDAAAATNGSAGTAIVASGITVLVSLLGLRVAGIRPFATFGYATAAVIFAVMISAVTLGPALCGMAGHRMARRGGGDPPSQRSRITRWAQHVSKRPASWTIAAIVLLLLLAAPALGMRTWPRDAGSPSASDTVRRAHDLIAAEFGPGANGPFTICVDATQVTSAQLNATMSELRDDAGVAAVSEPVYSIDRTAAVFTIEPTTAPHDEATADTLRQVRAQLSRGMYVTGLTPYFVDVSAQLHHRLWLLIIIVAGLAAGLVAIAFKAPVVAIMSAATKLLAVAATYGVLVVLFQWGWGAALFDMPAAVPLSSWAAILLFIILFGLSTDHEVFMLSRVREEWLSSGDAQLSVIRGIASTTHVVTTAATIMIAFFLAFALDPDIVIRMICVGVAVGLFIDTVVVRMVLAPAAMTWLGRANWWAPAWRSQAPTRQTSRA
jgi:RND superfamily putative drug exporter